jgi:hypothetical protein
VIEGWFFEVNLGWTGVMIATINEGNNDKEKTESGESESGGESATDGHRGGLSSNSIGGGGSSGGSGGGGISDLSLTVVIGVPPIIARVSGVSKTSEGEKYDEANE